MLLHRREYKKYIVTHIDTLNNLLEKKYSFPIKIIFNGSLLSLEKKWIDDNDLYTYQEHEDSLELIDRYIKSFAEAFLFTKNRKIYLLDIIKRIWDIKKSEELLRESIIKWYIN